jgi:hypothetical protein
MNRGISRICFIHAGTHKTASTYIQDRLLRNSSILRSHGLEYNFKGLPERRHKSIAMNAKAGSLDLLERHLMRNARSDGNILISAEQFTAPFSNPETVEAAKKLVRRAGYELRIVIFIRPQLEYMNSRYVQECKRFYHALRFNDYVKRYTGGASQDIFDYEDFLGELARSGLCTFLPFGKNHGDPFCQLAQVLELPPELVERLLPASGNAHNAQPGAKGVWLARYVTRQMRSKGVDSRSLSNTTKIIPKIAKTHGWDADRFYGFSKGLARETRRHYRRSNRKFARIAWGLPWNEIFPPALHDPNVFRPSSEAELATMTSYADEVLRYLASKNKKMAREITSCLVAA